MHIYKNHCSILITNAAAVGLIINELLLFKTDV